MTTEQWLPVPGYEGSYSVSDQGRVRSETRIIQRRTRSNGSKTMTVHERIISQPINLEGYHTAVLCRDGKQTKYTVHSLVLKAFRGIPETGQVARHLNSNQLDNTLSNLKWGTQSENIFDQVAAGTHNNAGKTHCSRGHEFTEENTYVPPGMEGKVRQCRKCQRIRNPRKTSRRWRKSANTH